MLTANSCGRALGLLGTSAASALLTALALQNSPRLTTRELWLVDGQDRVCARLGLDGCDNSPSLTLCAPGRLDEPRLRIGLTWVDSPEIQLFDRYGSPDAGAVLTISNHGMPASPLLRLERHADANAKGVEFQLGLGDTGPSARVRDASGTGWRKWP